ncbi:MAG TPA: PQQ-dependent sugar dehydrogenase [Flavobacterium sp.]|jgi:glucose/arabinose dehydrogenase|uniref:PQQ-dependent sugar dehydrogenase n=1 Tax=Flavobacterium sp. TaxID=239 RepID=UPI002C33D5D7|nr:PQQ-dependent sugar dehydrogenase [Flavobacterium sp.]MCA0349498.1 PQQ-dependent sugar dehydrogenase [Bacteroidota bacterium]HPW97916.1 PQQ-dependent sugar dehydrogenase [Flavobacterium sp.]HQA73500.1 PQQ-dependent sugar dehydrogenase [Flavobacterium sp.]
MKKILLSLLLLFSFFINAQTVAIQSFATGFSSAVAIVHPPNDSRLFVVQKTGAIRILNTNGTINTTPFLTITGLTSGSEQGLLGLAFHPNYASNGQFFVNYTNSSGDTVIAKYTVSSNPDVANTTSTTLLTIDQPFSNHNGGSLVFGSDGYLYIGMGDGGSGNDPNGYAQNLTVDSSNPSRIFLGKILRLDVDSASPYGIPATNPFVGQAGKEEIWAYGIRNPWKFNFNRLNGDLWIADVGQDAVEEIDKVSNPLPNTGLNFGWRCYEGTSSNITGGCPAFSSTVAPFTQYNQTTARCSITGGYFYTGSMYPNFANKYFFADYCSGEIGLVSSTGSITWALDTPSVITSFGEDVNGELYITNGSTVSKIIDTSLSNTNFDKNTIRVYPNPAKTQITIDNSSNTTFNAIQLIDITGKILYAENNLNATSKTINTSHFTAGLYIVVAEDLNGNQFKSKVIIE